MKILWFLFKLFLWPPRVWLLWSVVDLRAWKKNILLDFLDHNLHYGVDVHVHLILCMVVTCTVYNILFLKDIGYNWVICCAIGVITRDKDIHSPITLFMCRPEWSSTPTSTPSTGWLLWLSCGWTSTWVNISFHLGNPFCKK
jgi:hypothetical protein